MCVRSRRLITLLVARAANGVIGDRGGMPWNSPSDLRWFRARTMGHAIVYGRRTLESLPGGCELPGRNNLVVGRGYITSLEAALDQACGNQKQSVFVIGGQMIFDAMLRMIEQPILVCVTQLEQPFEGDRMFPDLCASAPHWNLISQGEKIDDGDLRYHRQVFVNQGAWRLSKTIPQIQMNENSDVKAFLRTLSARGKRERENVKLFSHGSEHHERGIRSRTAS